MVQLPFLNRCQVDKEVLEALNLGGMLHLLHHESFQLGVPALLYLPKPKVVVRSFISGAF